MKALNSVASELSGILPNKKLNRWEVWYNGKMLMANKNYMDCIWFVNYKKLARF